VQDGERGVSQCPSQPLLELTGRSLPPQLDHQTAGGGVALSGLQLAGDEPDGDDAVLLRGVQQPRARALPRRVVLEADLPEARERVPYVRLVMDGQPSPPARVDVGEGAVAEAGALAGVEAGQGC